MDDFCDKLFGTLDYFNITKLDYMNMTSALADYDNRLREMKILEESQLSAEFDNNDLPF